MATLHDKLDLLVTGYVSTEIKAIGLHTVYPTELNALIVPFVGNIFMRFDLIYEDYRDCIDADGTIVRRGATSPARWFSVLSSHTIRKGDVCEFKIKCVKPKSDSIGIMSNKAIIKEEDSYHSWLSGAMYYYHGDGRLHQADGVELKDQTNAERFLANDVITVHVDCIKWKLVFKRNTVVVGGAIDIEPNVYYPFIGTKSDDVEYQLVL